ncbi:MAG: YicC family protein [Bacteroidales bacterium]|nr:YicC family protein [Bacteroidales bacterium]MBR1795573.1 YicC family protein [Bacteroidales bacterium]
MIQSMTGYGKAEAQLKTGKLTVEIRTLNAKSADINIKTPLLPKDKDIPVRKKLADRLQRGTIDFFLTLEAAGADSVRPINTDALKAYYNQVLQLRQELPGFIAPGDESNSELLASLLRLPDVVDAKKVDAISDEEWPVVEAAIDEALDHLQQFRSQEGAVLYRDVTGRVQTILGLYDEVEALEGERIETVKARLLKNLEELAQKPDPARFEQELIFYLEKYDINEEKVRLRQHCRYFMETIDNEPNPGKKLGFIIQEMGREINTTGSKANHAGIQRLVVRMKDELEKIREQSMNIL